MTESQLWDYMTTPTEALKESLARIEGDIMVLGGSGKMGKELIGLIRNGDRMNGKNRKIVVASTFSNPDDIQTLKDLDVKCIQGDLSSEAFLNTLPDAPLVIYMMGFKFGSGKDYRRTFHLNSIVPYLVGKKYARSRIVIFSSGNPYPHSYWLGSGCKETEPLDPKGVYGWSIVARESSFSTTAHENKEQQLCFFRLMYAQHLQYGVLVDLAKLVYNDEPVSLKMPAVNLVSQRDANEIAIRSFEYCENPAWRLNVAGPAMSVRKIVGKMAAIMDKQALFADQEGEMALLANDEKCRTLFGEYRDRVEDMIEGAALWVMNEKETWDKPTYFGRVEHDY